MFQSLYWILHEKLRLSKVSARCIPRILIVLDRQRRMLRTALPERWKWKCAVLTNSYWLRNVGSLLRIERKLEFMEWNYKNSPSLKKFRVQKSAGRTAVFWNLESILMLDYLPARLRSTSYIMLRWWRNMWFYQRKEARSPASPWRCISS